jgi:hypothetical protein
MERHSLPIMLLLCARLCTVCTITVHTYPIFDGFSMCYILTPANDTHWMVATGGLTSIVWEMIHTTPIQEEVLIHLHSSCKSQCHVVKSDHMKKSKLFQVLFHFKEMKVVLTVQLVMWHFIWSFIQTVKYDGVKKCAWDNKQNIKEKGKCIFVNY